MGAVTERRPPNWGRVARRLAAWVLIGVPTLLGLALLLSADARYLARAGLEEARILLRRRSIATLVADPGTPAALRQRLALGLAARSAPGVHLALPRRRDGALQGLLRLRAGPSGRRGSGARGLRHLSAARGRVLDARLFFRPAVVHGDGARHDGARGDGPPRAGAQHAVREEPDAFQRELRQLRGLPRRRGVFSVASRCARREACRGALAGRAHARRAVGGARPPPRLSIRAESLGCGARAGARRPVRVGAGAADRSGGAVARDVRLALVRQGAAQQRGRDRAAALSDEPEPVRGGLRPRERGLEGNDPRHPDPRVHPAGAGPVSGVVFPARAAGGLKKRRRKKRRRR